MKLYLKACRAPFLSASIVPVIIGSAYAYTKGYFAWQLLLLTLLATALLHLASNLINDYFDAKGSDAINQQVTPFSGGSGVIPNRELSAIAILIMAIIFCLLATTIGIVLIYLGRPWIAVIGLIGLIIIWSYSAPPLKLMSRGFGEIIILLTFGPMITFGSYYAQTNHLDLISFLIGIPQGLLIACIILINEFPDYAADKQAGKNNLVVKFGPDIGNIIYQSCLALSFILILPLIFLCDVPYQIGLVFLTTIRAIRVSQGLNLGRKDMANYKNLIPAQAATIQLALLHGILFSLGLWIAGIIA